MVALPARTPASIATTLYAALAEAMADPALRERMTSLDLSPGLEDGARAQVLLNQTLERYTRVVQATGLKADK